MAGLTRSREEAAAAASVIKSIQRGQTTIASNNNGNATGTSVTINAVNLNKSFVSISCRSGFGAGNFSNTSIGGQAATVLGGYLSGTTTLSLGQGRWYRQAVYAHTGGIAYWEVIEYE